jgi:hypothetical protein
MKGRADRLFRFTWSVMASGYQWLPAQGAGPADVDRLFLSPLDYQKASRSYSPLSKCPGLFLELARTEQTPEGLLAFANQYGGLFHPEGRPEDYLEWARQVADLSVAVRLWRLIQEDGPAGLARHIFWGEDRLKDVLIQGRLEDQVAVYYTPGPEAGPSEQRMIASARMAGGWMEQFQPGDVVLPAMIYVRALVNRRLDEHVAPRLNHDPGGAGDNPTQLVLDLEPKNLLGAVWLQLAQAVGGNRKFRECGGCRRWFECSLAARSDKLYCSDACRARAYRERPTRAAHMRAGGKSMKEIAESLSVDEAQVRKWLRSPRTKEK